MPIPVTCPNCNTTLRAPDNAAGRQVRCPKCQTPFAVPAADGIGPPPLMQVMPVAGEPVRRDDHDDDYEDEPRRFRRREPVGNGGGLPMGLGIAALSVGIIGGALAFFPCIGWYLGLPFAGIGLVLGLVGFFIAMANCWQGVAFPAAGSAVSLVATLICVGWWLWWDRRVSDIEHGFKQLGEAVKKLPPPQDLQLAQEKAQATNNLREIGLGLHAFHDANGALPQAFGEGGPGGTKLSWRVAILPYINQEPLYRAFRHDEPWDSPHNKQFLNQMPAVYAPTRGGGQLGHTYVQVFTGPNTPFRLKERRRFTTFKDGLSNTFLAVEGGRQVPWTKPEDLPFDRKGPLPPLGGPFTGDFHALLGDGSVRFIQRNRYPDDLLRNLIDPADGMVINWPD